MIFLSRLFQVSLYSEDTSAYDERDESYQSSEEEREHYCEVCDREFPTDETLQRHKEEHRVCGIDDCVFAAHPKLVEKHISMQHSTGLYQRMKNLSTPEDVEKWIMERKKRYPTKANIEHLKAEALEKRQRYEIIREKKSVTEHKTTKKETKKVTKRRNRKRQIAVPVAVESNHEAQLYNGVRAFAGTLSLRESTDDTEYSLIEDSDNELEPKNVDNCLDDDKIEQTTSCTENNAFSLSLVADYGTDSDKDEKPEEVPFKKVKLDIDNLENVSFLPKHENKRIDETRPRNNNSRDKSKDFEKERKIDDECKDVRRGQRFQRNTNNDRNSRGKNQKTNKIQLLNKLLSRSIQRERNLISQCIKYIVDNNYFQ